MSREEMQQQLLDDILAEFGEEVKSAKMDYGMPVVRIERAKYLELVQWLKNHEKWHFNHFIDITAVDYVKPVRERFEVVVHLRSHEHNFRVRIKTRVHGEKPHLPSLYDTFIGSTWTEREVFDLFGITFDGHPRMTRLLNPDDFEGHPLRKDFPIKGTHRGSFPKGTVISNKRREPMVTLETHAPPLDQLMPNTPEERKRAPMRGEGEDA